MFNKGADYDFDDKKDYELILEHAKSCVPEEACGLIAGVKNGDDKEIKKVYILTNIDHSNEHFHSTRKSSLQQSRI